MGLNELTVIAQFMKLSYNYLLLNTYTISTEPVCLQPVSYLDLVIYIRNIVVEYLALTDWETKQLDMWAAGNFIGSLNKRETSPIHLGMDVCLCFKIPSNFPHSKWESSMLSDLELRSWLVITQIRHTNRGSLPRCSRWKKVDIPGVCVTCIIVLIAASRLLKLSQTLIASHWSGKSSDTRRIKRLVSNRESAWWSRRGKQAQLTDLQLKAQSLMHSLPEVLSNENYEFVDLFPCNDANLFQASDHRHVPS